MSDCIEYVVAELKNKRLSKAAAIDLSRDCSVHSRKANGTARLAGLQWENTSELGERRYSRRFTGEEFFLADHVVEVERGKEERVLPAVAYLEMVRAGVEKAWPGEGEGKVLELRHTMWEQPVRVGSEGKQIHLGLREMEEKIEYEIYSEEEGEKVVHCRGLAAWNEEEASHVDVEQVKMETRQGGAAEPGRIYARCAKVGLLYGPAMQGMSGVRRGEHEVLAEVRLPETVEKTWGEYVLHPSLLDSALQAAVALLGDELGGETQLPFALERVRILGRSPREVLAWARYESGSERAGNKGGRRGDIDVCDETGKVWVEVRGLSTRVVKRAEAGEGRVAKRESESELECFVPVWDAVVPEKRRKSESGGKVLLSGGDAGRS